MSVQSLIGSRRGLTAIGLTTLVVLLIALASGCPNRVPAPPPPDSEPADLPEQVQQFCGKSCHKYPPPHTFPRSAWKEEVERGYRFFRDANLPIAPPPIEQVIRYYQDRAPEQLPAAAIEHAKTSLPVRFEPVLGFKGPAGSGAPTISNVSLVHLSDPNRLDILACDMGHPDGMQPRKGFIMAMNPRDAKPEWRILAKLNHPAHAEVVDLNGDGIKDILVADLGSFPPTDESCGSVVWLRGNKDGSYTPFTLLKGVGRVADVQAADLNGDGKLDLIVAVFGWQKMGEILVLENQTTDWDKPVFKPHVIDKRHGAIHVPAADLNGDGKPDFIALIAQEHEEICAFINQGDFRFEKKPLFAADHPAYGSSGIQLVDLDGDGHVDVLYTNGDVLDSPHLLKPYHGIQWLRNRGDGSLTFDHKPIAPMYGVHRAVAAKVTGGKLPDIVAVSYLPVEHFPQRDKLALDSIILLEQTSPGKFARHTLATKSCDHVTCVLGDLYGTGRIDLVTANFTMDDRADALVIRKNLGR